MRLLVVLSLRTAEKNALGASFIAGKDAGSKALAYEAKSDGHYSFVLAAVRARSVLVVHISMTRHHRLRQEQYYVHEKKLFHQRKKKKISYQ